MSTKTAGIRLQRVSPGGRMLRQAVLKLVKRGRPVQVTSTNEAALRGLRQIFSPEECERLEIELTPFGNLVSRVCRMAGVQTLRIAQSGQDVAAIAEACRRLPTDSPLAQTSSMPGIHAALAKSLGTLRAYGLDAARLDLAAEAADPYLASKLRSLGFLLRESSESLRELGREHMTSWLERTVATDPAACDSAGHVAILVAEGLDSATANWIAWLGRTQATVTVIGEVHPGVPAMFDDLDVLFPALKPALFTDAEGLTSRLFVREATRQADVALEIVAAPDLLAECEWALRRCQTALAAGKTLGRVAIVARELSSYAPVLQAAGRRLGIQVNVPWRAPLLSNRLIGFFLDLLAALGSPDIRALMKPLRSPYSGLPFDTVSALDGVLRDLRRSGSSAWDVLESVSGALTEQVAWLAPVLEWRSEAQSKPAEPWEWFGRIMALAELIPWQDAAVECGQFVERDARAQAAMQGAITERASLGKVRPSPPLSYDAAVHWLREAWEAADYSVPSLEGGIRVVAAGAEIGDADVVLAVGMLEGILPRRPREDPILGDLERCELSRITELDLPLPTSRSEAVREREEFVRICGSTSETLVLSHRLATGDRNNIPTAYVDEAARLCASVTKTVYSRTQFTPESPTLAPDVALHLALAATTKLADIDFVDENVRSRFKWDAGRAFEPQQVRRAVQCPFRSLARDQLNLRPSRRLQLWNSLLDLPVIADLILQPDQESALRALSTALDDLVDTHVGRLADWELAVIKSGGRRMIADWVDREFRARTMWPRGDVRAKVAIGSPGVLNKAAADVTLTGAIPGTARMGQYALVRLYEAGAPERLGRDSNDAAFVYYALWAVLAKGDAAASAIEVETLGHARRLFVLPRQPGPLPSDAAHGLFAAAVTVDEDDVMKSVKVRARGLIRLAVDQARNGVVSPKPSADHCPACGYGELCRRSIDFGEGDDPFEVGDA
ncbi:MAG: PD-(D/E)XK nuclease family protein [Fimbriimonadaceae bacterium]